MGRGALIVLEGCDRAGKSTQAKMLASALARLGLSTECRQFPSEYIIGVAALLRLMMINSHYHRYREAGNVSLSVDRKQDRNRWI